MGTQRVLRLLASSALFGGLSLLLISRPELAPALFPLFGILFLWLARAGEEEAPVLFLFLICLLGLFLLTRPALKFPDIVAVLVEMVGLGVLLYGLSVYRYHH